MVRQTTSGIPAAVSETPSESSLSERVSVWLSRILALLILGLGLWTAFLSGSTIYRTYSPVNYWDQWTVIDDLQKALPITRLWAQHNEHRPLIARLALHADIHFFHGRNASLSIEIYIIQLLLVLLFVWACFHLARFRGMALITVGGFFAYCILSPLQIENFFWGFQVTYVFAGLAATTSFACLVWHAANVRKSHAEWSFPLVIALLAALLAEYSIADGLLVWLVIVWMAYCLRLPKRTQVLAALAGVVAIGTYFIGYYTPLEHSDPWMALRHPFALAKFIVTYFGYSWDPTLPSLSSWPTVSESVTVLAIGFVVANAIWTLYARDGVNLFRLFLLANMVFTLGAAVLTSLGRLNESATLSRYQSIALVFWASLVALVLASIQPEHRGVTLISLQIALLILMAAGAGRFDSFVRVAVNHQIAVNSAYSTLAADPPNLTALKTLHPQAERVLGWFNYLRSNKLGPDPREFYDWGGYRIAPASSCAGFLDLIQFVAPNRRIAQGWAWDVKAKRTPKEILLASRDGVVVGSGDIDSPRPDVLVAAKPYLDITDSRTGWSAEVQAQPGIQVRAFALLADSKSICPLNQERQVP